MARPKKEKELKRNHIVTLRFNDTEYEIVTGNAKDTGLPLAEFLRRQVMKGKVIAKYEVVKMAGDFHGDTETHSK